MEIIKQGLDEILAALQPLKVDWEDDVARRVIEEIRSIPRRDEYTVNDVENILEKNFDDGLLICRLFLGLSKDQFSGALRDILGDAGSGFRRYKTAKEEFLDALVSLGILESMDMQINRPPQWSDVLVERLRSGRGSAISGQKRGKSVEDFAENIIKEVFGDSYAIRCTFVGKSGFTAKCDFAIPSKEHPRILIEAKGYGATGSKMTDVIGDLQKIISAKRSDTSLLFFTDGLTWRQRKNDFRRLIEFQNSGDIARIYCYSMAENFKNDLIRLKQECGL
jgi:hypothetical protein